MAPSSATSPYPSYLLSRHSREVSPMVSLNNSSPQVNSRSPRLSTQAKRHLSAKHQPYQQPYSEPAQSSSSSLASFRMRQQQAEHTLSQMALEAATEQRVRRGKRHRRVWRWVAWLVATVLEGWVGYCTVRYLVAFILMDPGMPRTLNLTFFITSLLAVLALPLLFFAPVPFNLLALTFSALLTLLTAASQLAVFKSWENVPAPTGFASRCGWNMDASWGRGAVCDGWQWGGWVGVLCARLVGSFLLLALLALAYVKIGRKAKEQPIRLPSSPTIPYYSGNHHRSTSSSLSFIPPSHEPKPPPTSLPPPTQVFNHFTPALWSEEDRDQRREKRERELEEHRWKGERDELLQIARKAAQRAAAFSALVKNTDLASRDRHSHPAHGRTLRPLDSTLASSTGPRTVQASPYLRSTLPAPLDLSGACFPSNEEAEGPLVIIRSPSQPTVAASPLKDISTPESSPTDRLEHWRISPSWTTPDFPLPPPLTNTRSSVISVLTRLDDGEESRLSTADSFARSSLIESLTGSDLGGGPLVSPVLTETAKPDERSNRRWSSTDIMRRKAVPSILALDDDSADNEVLILNSPPLSGARPTSATSHITSRVYKLTADAPLEGGPLDSGLAADDATPKRMSRPKSLSPTYHPDVAPSADNSDDEEDDFVAPAVRRNAMPPSLFAEHRLSTLWSASEGSLASRFEAQQRRSSEAERRGSDFSIFGTAAGGERGAGVAVDAIEE